jgi:hypothetical protein
MNWKGGKTITRAGYRKIKKPDHPRAVNGYVFEHIIVIEEFLGYILPLKYRIHHKDGNKLNNDICNLIVCPNESIHRIIHTNEKSLREYGDAKGRKCCICHKYDMPNNMNHNVKSRNYIHRDCKIKYDKELNTRKKCRGDCEESKD